MVDLVAYYRAAVAGQRKQFALVIGSLLVVFNAAAAAKEAYAVLALGSLAITAAALVIYRRESGRNRARLHRLGTDFPDAWRAFLDDRSTYYRRLSGDDKRLFELRVLVFLADVRIEGVDTAPDDEIKLMVAAAAIIPAFAFPYFEYPFLREVLIYPEAFNERFETDAGTADEEHSSGMVGSGFMNYTVLLSLRELAAGFSGVNNSRNVGIHEFVHLLDKADGATDGVPAILMDAAAIPAWLELMDREMKDIERGRSDIDPYALTDHAEFFAVVCEYFFNNPEKFSRSHPELYEVLCTMFQQRPDALSWQE